MPISKLIIYSLFSTKPMVAEAVVWYAGDPDVGLTGRLKGIEKELHSRLKTKLKAGAKRLHKPL